MGIVRLELLEKKKHFDLWEQGIPMKEGDMNNEQWEKYYKKSKSDTTGNLTLTVMCKPDLSGINRGVENPCLWKCSSVTCEIFMDIIILDKKLLDLFASHLFDEELRKALWLELLLHVERVNKRLIFVVADVHFGFTLYTSARCGFLLWRHVFFSEKCTTLTKCSKHLCGGYMN